MTVGIGFEPELMRQGATMRAIERSRAETCWSALCRHPMNLSALSVAMVPNADGRSRVAAALALQRNVP